MSVESNVSKLHKQLGKFNKMMKFVLFLFIFFGIFKIIDHIMYFFDISREIGYIYFCWFTALFFLFVVLPIQRSRLGVPSVSTNKEVIVGSGTSISDFNQIQKYQGLLNDTSQGLLNDTSQGLLNASTDKLNNK